MDNEENDLPKVFPFVSEPPPEPQPPSQKPLHKKRYRDPSERRLLSIVTLVIGLGAISVAMLGGAKLLFDILTSGLENNLNNIGAKAIVLGLAYLFGWSIAALSIRMYANLILPVIMNFYCWFCLLGVALLYSVILFRLYSQNYNMLHYWAYLISVIVGLGALVGLHFLIENHKLRPFSMPLLLVSLLQLVLIVYRYVFSEKADVAFLWKDLLFFFVVTIFSGLMYAHFGILSPFRKMLNVFFEKHKKALEPDN